jgi:alpha-ketoglutarate-dependent taurine dioxygenase
MSNARPLLPGSRVPQLIESQTKRSDLRQLFAENKGQILQQLVEFGALLFRGFQINQDTFGSAIDALGLERLDYIYRSTPRENVADRVFTATAYPAHREIPLHCENAFQRDWPMQLAFYCVEPAATGGETPLADVARVTERIGPEIVKRFRKRKVRYTRNYRAGVDLSWTEVFQTRSRVDVERYCREHGISYVWASNEELRTSQTCQGTAVHPILGTELWFNQAHLFHVSSLGTQYEHDLLNAFGVDGLPRNAFYGDGEPISASDLESIRAAFAAEAITFTWQANDLLLVDNMQVAHGRRSYVGKRLVLVTMTNPYSRMLDAYKTAGEKIGSERENGGR